MWAFEEESHYGKACEGLTCCAGGGRLNGDFPELVANKLEPSVPTNAGVCGLRLGDVYA